MAKICKNCGAELPDEAGICLNCFTEFEKETSVSAIHAPKNNKRKALLIACILIALILIPSTIVSLAHGGNAPVAPEEPVGASSNSNIESDNNSNENSITQSAEGEEETTKKKGGIGSFFDNLFNRDNGKSDDNASSNVSSSSGANQSSSISQSASKPQQATNADSTSTTKKPAQPTTTKPTQTKPTVPTTSNEPPVLNISDYEYKNDGDGVAITKYKGKSRNIIIPDKLNGRNVTSIEENAFSNNSLLETVTFKDSEDYHVLWVHTGSFNNLSSLKKITFPKNTDLGILYAFAYNCPKFEDISIDHWQYRFVNGALYYNNTSGWYMNAYCEGYQAAEYHMPDYCQSFNCDYYTYNNLASNKYLKKIYLNDRDSVAPPTNCSYPNLEGIYAPSNNKYLFDVNGVLFQYGNSANKEHRLVFYPSQNKQKTFTYPDNSLIYFGSYTKNDYVETFVIPANCTFLDSDLEYVSYKFKNLKTIKISKNNKQIQQWKDNFIGSVVIY